MYHARQEGGRSSVIEDLERNIVGEKFHSRKNMVFKTMYAGKLCVAKVYRPEFRGRERAEYSILMNCSRMGVRAPLPIKLLDGAIVMEYVDGANVADLFDSLWEVDPSGSSVMDQLRELLDGVAAWLARFHSVFGHNFVRGDAVLRNFIVKGDSVWGMDFEEASERDPLFDVGQTCSNILSLDPQFTPAKFALTKDFASMYWKHSGVDRSADLPEMVAEGLRHFARSRDDSVLLEEWAGKIERRGLDQ